MSCDRYGVEDDVECRDKSCRETPKLLAMARMNAISILTKQKTRGSELTLHIHGDEFDDAVSISCCRGAVFIYR